VDFELLGKLNSIEPIATGRSIRDVARLRKQYGPGRWKKMKEWPRVRLYNGRTCLAELHWYEAHGFGRKRNEDQMESARLKTRKRPSSGVKPVLCVNNRGYPASLEVRKMYWSIPDQNAERDGMIRVIDESGEDYLYADNRFVAIELPLRARKILSSPRS